MSRSKTFSTSTYYGDDYLFAKAAVFTLIVGVVTLVVLLMGSVISAQGRATLSKTGVSGRVGARPPPRRSDRRLQDVTPHDDAFAPEYNRGGQVSSLEIFVGGPFVVTAQARDV
ncbi:hypothetical protein MTO96_009028 [Rhipicephalus appendiculatus]